jgi:hypothetical protein
MHPHLAQARGLLDVVIACIVFQYGLKNRVTLHREFIVQLSVVLCSINIKFFSGIEM